MSIIIDNFKVNVGLPIDSRFVVNGVTERNALEFKYNGLRVWDISDNKAYYWNGTTWNLESSGSAGASGTPNFISKFITSNTLGDTNIFDNGDFVGINTTIRIGTEKLNVNGQILANSYKGVGTEITQLNADNVSTGKLSLNYLNNGTNGYILRAGTSVPSWVDPNTITFGSATNATNATNSDKLKVATNTADASKFITFVDNNSGYNDVYVSNNIKLNPSTGQVLLSNGSTTKPSYSFINDSNSGMYLSSASNLVVKGGSGQIQLNDTTLTMRVKQGVTLKDIINVNYNYVEFKTQLFADLGSLTAPSYSFVGNSGTGMYIDTTTGWLAFSIGGSISPLQINTQGTKVVSGIEVAPGYSFLESNNSGMYYSNTGKLCFSVSGFNSLQLTTTGIKNINGTSTNPSISFINQTNTGIYQSSTNTLAISTNGSLNAEFSRELNDNYMKLTNGANTLLLRADSSGTSFQSSAGVVEFWKSSVGYHTLKYGIAKLNNISALNGTSNIITLNTDNSMNIGSGTNFKKIVMGKFIINDAGASPVVTSGNGFTVTFRNYSLSPDKDSVYINISGISSANPFFMASVREGSGHFPYLYTWEASNNRMAFEVNNLSSGSVWVDFILVDY